MAKASRPSAPIGRPPTQFARDLQKYVLGFGVAFAAGLAPYLGLVDVPGFRALLTLFPSSLQNVIIPLAAAAMGIIAVVTQWHASGPISAPRLNRTFRRVLPIAVASLMGLLVMYKLAVVTVSLDGGESAASFVVGFSRLPTCSCPANVSNAECIKGRTLETAAIASCWGDIHIGLNEIALVTLYLLATGSFVSLVGLLLLRRQSTTRRRDPPKRPRSRRRTA